MLQQVFSGVRDGDKKSSDKKRWNKVLYNTEEVKNKRGGINFDY